MDFGPTAARSEWYFMLAGMFLFFEHNCEGKGSKSPRRGMPIALNHGCPGRPSLYVLHPEDGNVRL